MEAVTGIIGFTGVGIIIIAQLWTVIVAAYKSPGWAFFSLLLTPVAIIYTIKNPEYCKIPLTM